MRLSDLSKLMMLPIFLAMVACAPAQELPIEDASLVSQWEQKTDLRYIMEDVSFRYFDSVVDYKPNHSYERTGKIELSTVTSGTSRLLETSGKIGFSFESSGNWSLRNGAVTGRVRNITLTQISGEMLPPRDLRQIERELRSGGSQTARIRSITTNELNISDPESGLSIKYRRQS